MKTTEDENRSGSFFERVLNRLRQFPASSEKNDGPHKGFFRRMTRALGTKIHAAAHRPSSEEDLAMATKKKVEVEEKEELKASAAERYKNAGQEVKTAAGALFRAVVLTVSATCTAATNGFRAVFSKENASKAEDAIRNAAGKVKDKVSSITESAADAAKATKENVEENAKAATEQLKAKVEALRDSDRQAAASDGEAPKKRRGRPRKNRDDEPASKAEGKATKKKSATTKPAAKPKKTAPAKKKAKPAESASEAPKGEKKETSEEAPSK
ncbi:hypothetical protein JonanDRAFT_1552 [Jonquetella anthropi DSM 22815]|uniref:Uncharacterized protein n=2 Tax=Jonquetella TaxID=428711 RepID=H0UJE4_9BACT|nr:hypothetical protein [Jonquetella anthropi]EHM13911.1 hypothetical protein JonanDRAFT_1552 [Jonquetella anthropi DSM 22815]